VSALPELLEAVARVDPKAARVLEVEPAKPAPGSRAVGALLAAPPLVLLWSSVAASAVLALFTVPRIEAYREGLSAAPLELTPRALLLLAVCLSAALAFTLAERRRPRQPFARRLLEALAEGRDGASAVAVAAGLASVSDRPAVAEALVGGLGPVLGTAAAALLEGQRDVERGLKVLAQQAPEAAPWRLAAAARATAVMLATANAGVAYSSYLLGVNA
jgi:hypothetical protein